MANVYESASPGIQNAVSFFLIAKVMVISHDFNTGHGVQFSTGDIRKLEIGAKSTTDTDDSRRMVGVILFFKYGSFG
jgi:hypothetical protein